MMVKEVSFLFLAPDRVRTLDNLTAAIAEAEEAARRMTAAVIPRHEIPAQASRKRACMVEVDRREKESGRAAKWLA